MEGHFKTFFTNEPLRSKNNSTQNDVKVHAFDFVKDEKACTLNFGNDIKACTLDLGMT